MTNSERRVQRVRKALEPPQGARDDIEIILAIARRLGHDWTYDSSEAVWDELRSLSPDARRHELRSAWRSWAASSGPAPHEDSLEPTWLHGRLWAEDPAERGMPAPFSVVVDDPPVDVLDDDFPLRLTTGRRLDSYNTGVQSGGFASPLRFGETIDALAGGCGPTRHRGRRRGAGDLPARIAGGPGPHRPRRSARAWCS